jgi:hypothetical protein
MSLKKGQKKFNLPLAGLAGLPSLFELRAKETKLILKKIILTYP